MQKSISSSDWLINEMTSKDINWIDECTYSEDALQINHFNVYPFGGKYLGVENTYQKVEE